MPLGQGQDIVLLNAVTDGRSQAIPCGAYDGLTVSVRVADTPSAGAVVIEESTRADRSDPWSLVMLVDLTEFADSEQHWHLGNAMYWYLRARVTEPVVDGTVSVSLVAR